jgi:LAO/AO transport system kinase
VSASLPDVDELFAQVQAGNRASIGRALTVVASTRSDHRQLASALLARAAAVAAAAIRVGITGVPGAGKSTLVDALGCWLADQGHRVAVLAVDPSSTRTGGSILGDKTRMGRLSNHPAAFVRPSPTGGTLGGIAARTREQMLLLEAAGYDVVFVETVGVGQSETTVRDMVDTFVVVLIAGAGDELQGIKRGVLELADLVLVNKADGDRVRPARIAATQLRSALRLLHPGGGEGAPRVRTISALQEEGLELVWGDVADHRSGLASSGQLEALRAEQRVAWMWSAVKERLTEAFAEHPAVEAELVALLGSVRAGKVAPTRAAEQLVETFLRDER